MEAEQEAKAEADTDKLKKLEAETLKRKEAYLN